MSRAIVLTSFMAIIMFTMAIVPAFGAQMEFRMLPEEQNATATIKFQRTVFLEYAEGSELSDLPICVSSLANILSKTNPLDWFFPAFTINNVINPTKILM